MDDDPIIDRPQPVPKDQRGQGWLYRRSTIRLLWGVGTILLAGLALFDLIHPHKGHFGIDGTIGFFSWYGLVACAAMVIGAKLLGFVLKRRDSYYDEPGDA